MPKTTTTSAAAPEPGPDATPAVTELPRVALRYVGERATVPGLPARDLSLEEALALHPSHYAEALATGLYVAAKE